MPEMRVYVQWIGPMCAEGAAALCRQGVRWSAKGVSVTEPRYSREHGCGDHATSRLGQDPNTPTPLTVYQLRVRYQSQPAESSVRVTGEGLWQECEGLACIHNRLRSMSSFDNCFCILYSNASTCWSLFGRWSLYIQKEDVSVCGYMWCAPSW